MENEIWKGVVGFEGHYEVSNLGRIKSLSRVGRNNYPIKEKIMKPQRCSNDYLMIALRLSGATKQKLVHRIVGEAFIDNPDNLPYINHKDFDKTNNRAENLEYCTPMENMKHYFETVKSKSSKYVGVSYNSVRKEWEARIQVGGKSYMIGRKKKESDAIELHMEKKQLFLELGHSYTRKQVDEIMRKP